MRVICCGDRDWTDREIIRAALESLPAGSVVIHGAARGADRIAGEIATELGFEVKPYPAHWEIYGKPAGPIRNSEMLMKGIPDCVWAFHDHLFSESKGTRDMVNQALGAGVPVVLLTTTDAPWRLTQQLPFLPNHPGTCDCDACNAAYLPRRKAKSDGSS